MFILFEFTVKILQETKTYRYLKSTGGKRIMRFLCRYVLGRSENKKSVRVYNQGHTYWSTVPVNPPVDTTRTL